MKGKVIICLVVFLAVFGIITYRTVYANSNNGTIPNNGNSNIQSFGTIRSINRLNLFPGNAMAVNFSLGQPVTESPLIKGNTIQSEQNIGEYVVSLDEINFIAANNDGVIVYIPASGNVPVDGTTKDAILEIQRDLKRGNNTVGLFTLWHNSEEYSKIAEQTKLPAIVIARNGKGTVTLSGSNVNSYMLYQSYLKAAAEDCCEYFIPNCCY